MSVEGHAGVILPPWTRLQPRRIVFVGCDDHVSQLSMRINAGSSPRSIRTEVVRVLKSNGDDLTEKLLPETLKRERVWGLVVGADIALRLPAPLLLRCRLNGIHVLDEASFWERELHCIHVESLYPSWLLSGEGFHHGRLGDFGKRCLDLLIAAMLILFTLPLMLLIALLIKCDSRGPIFYRQERVGLHGRGFSLFKFRSMCRDAEPEGNPVWAAKRDPRITRVGRLIRYTRMDELPQLWNVFRGDMSLIGPRPERPYFVEQLAAAIPLYAERHSVKPGISGWAQVSIAYGASFEDAREKLRYDLYYIKNRSFFLDLQIMVLTLRVVLLQRGAR